MARGIVVIRRGSEHRFDRFGPRPLLFDRVSWGMASGKAERLGRPVVDRLALATPPGLDRVGGRISVNPGQLARAIRNGADQDAWRKFMQLYGPVVYGFARRRGLQDADAADLMQDVMRFGSRRDRPAGVRSQPGNVARLAVHDHPQQGVQFSLGPPHPAARVGRFGHQSIAEQGPDGSVDSDDWDPGVPAAAGSDCDGPDQGRVSGQHVAGVLADGGRRVGGGRGGPAGRHFAGRRLRGEEPCSRG